MTDQRRVAGGNPTDPARPKVGWIGFGDQGLPMATAIVQAGFALHAWGRRPTSLDGLADIAHHRHNDIASLAAASDIVGLCVGTDDDVMDLITGGLLDGLRPGSIVVNHGTGTPVNAARFTELCAGADVQVLDAPVSGGRNAALEHRLTTMVGGPTAAADRALPMFESFSRHVIYLGGPGSGQAAKLFNNALMIMNQAAIADTLALAASFGMDPAQLFDVLTVASAGSTVLGLFNTMITEDTVEHLSQVEALDIDLFNTAMREAGLDASEVTARGLSGAHRIADVVRLLNRPAQP